MTAASIEQLARDRALKIYTSLMRDVVTATTKAITDSKAIVLTWTELQSLFEFLGAVEPSYYALQHSQLVKETHQQHLPQFFDRIVEEQRELLFNKLRVLLEDETQK